MAVQAREQEILDLEARFWDAMQKKDAQSAGRMTDDKCIIVGAQGVAAIDAKSMATMTSEGAWELKHYEFDPKSTQVHFISDDVVIIAYTVKERVVVDGTEIKMSANDASVWVRRDGEWRCDLHTESVAGDPFGRDRR